MAIYWFYYRPTFESFANIELSSEEQVIHLYKELLQRQPTPMELKNASSDITSGIITIDGLQQRMIDSEEYIRIIKLQSNELAPELKKMLYEKKTLDYLSRLYIESTANPLNPKLVLPIRDIFQYIEYNDIAIRMVFKSPLWKEFERDLLNSFQLNKDDTIQMFEKTFVKEDLMKQAKQRLISQVSSIQDPPQQVQREMINSKSASINEPSLLLAKPSPSTIEGFTSDMTVSSAPIQEDDDIPYTVTNTNVKNTEKFVPKPTEDGHAFETFAASTFAMDSDMTPLINQINKVANNVFNKDRIAAQL